MSMQPFEKLSYRGKTRRLRQLAMNALLCYPMEVASVHLIEAFTNARYKMEQHFSIKVLYGIYSILKVKDSPRLPEIVNRTGNGFFSLMRLAGEWTIICEDGRMPDDSLVVDSSHGWRVFLIDEPLTFDMIGVIYRITEILKDAGISVMAISTFTTDAFLVREDDLQPSLRALQAGGFSVPDLP